MNLEKYYQGFSSKQLIFRKLRLNDVKDWEGFFIDNPNLKYIDMERIVDDIPFMANRWIKRQIERYEHYEFGQLAMILKRNNHLIGTVGFKYFDYKGQRIILHLCGIKPDYWRQGYGTESLKCHFNFIFKHNMASRLFLTVNENNIVSQKLLEKLDGEKIDYLQQSNRNAYLYQFLKEDWMNKYQKNHH